MAIGQPDWGPPPSNPPPELRSDLSDRPSSDPTGPPAGASGRDGSRAASPAESYPERLIREAIEAGEFDDLTGTGRPIPGRGTRDDELWWVRTWVRRNRAQDSDPNSSV